jgi:hypothetical protein
MLQIDLVVRGELFQVKLSYSKVKKKGLIFVSDHCFKLKGKRF